MKELKLQALDSALPVFPEVPRPALSMGACNILMPLFLSACGNVLVHQAAQKRGFGFSVDSKLHP